MKALVIIDIQKSMGHWFSWSYIKKVDNFLSKHRRDYDMCFMLMEPVQVPVTDGTYRLESDLIPSFLLDHLQRKPFYKTYNSRILNQLKLEGKLSPNNYTHICTGAQMGETSPVYLFDSLLELMWYLKRAKKVDLIGGRVTKCARLTESLLNQNGINAQILDEVCYDSLGEDLNCHSENVFDTEPTVCIRKGSADDNGGLHMMQIPFSNEDLIKSHLEDVVY